MNIEKYIANIKEQLKSQGYAGKKIDYTEFKELFKLYGNQFQEKDFAENVLEMTYDQYSDLKKDVFKAVILKKQLSQIIQQDIEEIKNKLGLEGYSGKLIDYSELQKLHQMYGKQMPEEKFARLVLDLNDTSYMQAKAGKRKVYVLKSLQNKALKEADKVKELLKQEGYEEQLIDYTELQTLHHTYGKQMTETNFAQKVLGLSNTTYLDMKNHGVRARILKHVKDESTQKYIQKIKTQLKEEGYAGKSIDYTEFLRLHQVYGSQLPEYKFAREVLEINDSSYKTSLKKRQRKAIILKSLVSQVSIDEIEDIKQLLKQQGYVGKLIDYAELQKLHKQYGSQMPEYKFAQEILEISSGLYGNLKQSETKRARVLKSLKNEPSQEEIERIQELIETKAIAGMLIDYSELRRLHKQYAPEMQEEFFAKHVLEIPSHTYSDMKDGKHKTQILCRNKKVELIHSLLLNESRWYTKEELKTICQQNGISIDKIIRQIISNGTDTYNQFYKKVLEEKGKLWIGRTALSEAFLENNISTIRRLAQLALSTVKRIYNISYNSDDDDLIQDCLIWLFQNAGEIEKNFSDYSDIMERKIFNTIRKGITIKILMIYGTSVKTISLQQKLKLKSGDEKELESRIPSEYNLENDVLGNVDFERDAEIAQKCIQAMKVQIEAGQSKQVILRNVQWMFGLSKEELLDVLENYLIAKKKIYDFEEEK